MNGILGTWPEAGTGQKAAFRNEDFKGFGINFREHFVYI
jgi:hypothetical protein